MVSVKGRSDSYIASLTQLGLAVSPISVRIEHQHEDINVDAWGRQPADVQFMLSSAIITMDLGHFDRNVLAICLNLSMGGADATTLNLGNSAREGSFTRAGTRLGGGVSRFAPAGTVAPNGTISAGNNYIGLNILSPVLNIPWRFIYAYLMDPPMEYPLGAEKTIVKLNWRCIPYTTDPWGGSTGAQGTLLWDHVLDT